MKEKQTTIESSQVIAESRVFRIDQVDLSFRNGAKRQYERLRPARGGAVMVIPMLDEDTFLMVREYAVGFERYEIGLPKGLIDAGESPLQAANRELMEEVGHGAKQLTALTTLSIAPNYMSHDIDVILAQELYPETHPGDEPEPLEVVPWKLSEISSLIANPEFSEARSLAGIYMARDYLRGELSL